jgi:tetratricopeptide (TPR) repeat protein
MELAPEDSSHAANLAILYFGQGRTEESLEVFRSFSTDPEWRPRTPTELLLSGLTALQEGQLEVACIRLEETLRFEPDNTDALQALAFASRALGRPEVTIAVFDRLLELNPERVALRTAFVSSLLEMGGYARAASELEQLVALVPEDYDRKLQLAEVLATCNDPAVRDGQRAAELAREVVQFTQEENVGALDIYGAALAESGDFGGALTYAEKALELARSRGMQQNVAAIEARRDLYLLGKPFHIEPPPQDETDR